MFTHLTTNNAQCNLTGSRAQCHIIYTYPTDEVQKRGPVRKSEQLLVQESPSCEWLNVLTPSYFNPYTSPSVLLYHSHETALVT